MYIEPLSFKAKYISSPNIKIKLNKPSEYKSCKVSFVELRPENNSDLKALLRTIPKWGTATFLKEVYEDMVRTQDGSTTTRGDIHDRFFALTAQKNNLEILKDDMLLGFMEVDSQKEDANQITYLQAHPKYINNGKDEPAIKNIGKAMLRCLKKITARPIEVESLGSAKSFYKSCGFKETKEPNILRWDANPDI